MIALRHRSSSEKTFQQIVCLGPTGLTESGKLRLEDFSREPVRYFQEVARNDEETLARLQGADAVLLRWRQQLSGDVLRRAHSLKYIGLCCSLFSPESSAVDVVTAAELGIPVTAIFDYGDEGVVEFILVHLMARFGKYFEPGPDKVVSELGGLQLGVIGMGTTGSMVTRAARLFGMSVVYYSRTRKPEIEASGVSFLQLDELMASSDVVTTHLPRHTRLLDRALFDKTRTDTLLINTSLGPTFEVPAFMEWINRDSHSALFDADGIGGFEEVLTNLPRTFILDRGSGWTRQARERLSEKVLSNLTQTLNSHSFRRTN